MSLKYFSVVKQSNSAIYVWKQNRYLNSSSLWISLFRVWRSLHSFPIFSARITRITFPPLSPPNFVSEGPPPMKGAQYSSTAGMKGCRASHFFIASPLSFNLKMYSMKNLIHIHVFEVPCISRSGCPWHPFIFWGLPLPTWPRKIHWQRLRGFSGD